MDLSELTTQEWFTLVEGTGGAMGAVVAAQPSGPSGFNQEMRAAFATMTEMAGQEWKTPFMQAFKDEIVSGAREQDPEYQRIAEEQKTNQPKATDSETAVQRSLQSMRDAAALVESKGGPEAAGEYKLYLYHLAEKTAEAAKEGGFLGIGGVQVSDKEKAVLAQIKQMLEL
jgi:hypothetical protein